MSQDNISLSRDNKSLSRDNISLSRDNILLSQDNISLSRDNKSLSRDNREVSQTTVYVYFYVCQMNYVYYVISFADYLSNELLFFEVHSLINQTACTIKLNNAR
jgi:hypothetical protein